MKFEAGGKRASIRDEVLIERWSDRSKVNNNKHIYYGLRQNLFPVALLIVDPVNRRYAWEDDEEFLHGRIQPDGFTERVIALPPHSQKL